MTDRNFSSSCFMYLITLTDGLECSWSIHSINTIGASYSLLPWNIEQTCPMKLSRSKTMFLDKSKESVYAGDKIRSQHLLG